MKRGQEVIRGALVLVLAFILIAFGFIAASRLGLTSIHDLAEFIISFGIFGPLVLILLAIIAGLTGVIPSYPLTMLSGAIWGVIEGSIYVIIGIQTGAVISFMIARYGIFENINVFLGPHIQFYNKISDKYVTRFIFISRLLPIFVFELISYGAGFTNIKFWHYFWATLLGMIPVTILLAYTGRIWFDENGWLLIVITVVSMAVLIALPWVIEKYNPLGLKEKLLREDAK